MKKVELLCVLVLTLLPINFYGQDVTQVTFINELDNKAIATYGDALIMFKLQAGSSLPSKGDSGSNSYILKGYTEADILTKGMASLMTAKYLDLDGSIMYLVFGTERYAYKACIADGIFTADGSENDRLTGPELIELLSKISDKQGGN